MKTPYLLALVGLAISFALPTLAQQTTPDPQLRQQLLTLAKKFDDAMNNNDATALAALYAEDAVEVTDHGPLYGREAIEKHYAELFQKVHFSNWVTTYDQYSPHVIGTAGKEFWENGACGGTITVQGQTGGPIKLKGYHSSVSVSEGGVLKKRLLTSIVNAEPAATPSPTATPINQ